MRTQVIRAEVQRLLWQVPFRPFLLILENGDRRIPIGHPENIAFDPGEEGSEGGSQDFYVISGALRLFSTFEAVSNVVLQDRPEAG